MTAARQWFSDTSWDSITAINQRLCEAKKVVMERNKRHDVARKLWEAATPKPMSLLEAIDLCRQCNNEVPFTYNSGNTFASICGRLVADWTRVLPPLEAHMLETAVAHYVNGKIAKAELKTTLRHAEKIARPPTPGAPGMTPVIVHPKPSQLPV
jgi:hypothetical protein